MKPHWYISRRTVLRSAGASIGLPFLEAMVRPGRAAAADAAPKRFIAIWALPTGVVAKRDDAAKCWVAPWTPAGSGPLSGITPDTYLKPFFDKNLQSKITLLTGLTFRQATHHHCQMLISPVSTSIERGNCGNLPKGPVGPTMDVLIGNHARKEKSSLMQTLVVTSHPPVPMNASYNNISWDAKQQYNPNEVNPRTVFNTLFGNGDLADTAAAKAELMRRQQYEKSILDFVRNDAGSVMVKLGHSDRARMDQFLTSVRQLEQQLEAAPPPLSCSTPGAAPADPPNGYFDDGQLDVRVKHMADLVVKALECDRTRSVALMFVRGYGDHNGYPHLGISGKHHGRSHYGTNAQDKDYMTKYTRWALERYAYFLSELDRRMEPDGSTLLDNSIVFMGGEHADSNHHTMASLPLILGGRGGRSATGSWAINAGRHVRFPAWKGSASEQYNRDAISAGLSPSTPMKGEISVRDLQWGILNSMGLNLSGFGDATRPLDLTGWAEAVAS